ncbi:MAG: hypothetical protein LUO93_00490 [Methanomicrobiales archaeon]|nr:hypothetical protein [Methanomicrobiales archaeon]
MDDMTLLLILGAMAFVLAVSLVLQMMTMRDMQSLKNRLTALQTRPPVVESPPPQKREFTVPILPKDMDLLIKRHNSIEESISALAELARVEGITLATRDGLVVASNHRDAQQDAATFSHLINKGGVNSDPGVKLWQIEHKAGTLIGIVRSKEQLAGEKWAFMKENVSKILNYWL